MKKERIHYRKQVAFYIRNKERLNYLINNNKLSANDLHKIYKRPLREMLYFLKLFGWKDKIDENFRHPNIFKKAKNLRKIKELMDMDTDLLQKVEAKEKVFRDEIKGYLKEMDEIRKECEKDKKSRMKPVLEKKKKASYELNKILYFKKRMDEASKMFSK